MVQLLAACLGPPCSGQSSLAPGAAANSAAAAAVAAATTALAAALAYPDPATACASTADSVAPPAGQPPPPDGINRQRGPQPLRPHNHQLQPQQLQPQQVALIMELCEGGSLGGRIHNPAKRRLEYGEVLQVRHGYDMEGCTSKCDR